MPQTKVFRDRVVSMEQTLERGEKNLELLKSLCREAFPGFEYREHILDHERDLFMMTLEAPDGRRKRVCWTRMVLFDAERLPTLISDPESPLGLKLLNFLRAHSGHSEIVVTFRHLEDGWVDTPEPRRQKRRGRRGSRSVSRGGRPREETPVSLPRLGRPPWPPAGEREAARAPLSKGADDARAPSSSRRRRFRRRRRRGRRSGNSPPGSAPGQAP